jgi:hypothetical protein
MLISITMHYIHVAVNQIWEIMASLLAMTCQHCMDYAGIAKRVAGLAAALLKALANRSPLLKLVRPGFPMAIVSIPFLIYLFTYDFRYF